MGYESTKSVYRAKDCSHCSLRRMCYKGKADQRIIDVNHRNNEIHSMADELMASDEGLGHRNKEPIEPGQYLVRSSTIMASRGSVTEAKGL